MKLKDMKFKGRKRFVRRTIKRHPSVVDLKLRRFAPFFATDTRDGLFEYHWSMARSYSWKPLTQ